MQPQWKKASSPDEILVQRPERSTVLSRNGSNERIYGRQMKTIRTAFPTIPRCREMRGLSRFEIVVPQETPANLSNMTLRLNPLEHLLEDNATGGGVINDVVHTDRFGPDGRSKQIDPNGAID